VRRTATLAGIALGLGGAVLSAQQSGFKRTPLLDRPLGVPGHHVVTARVDIGPGIESGRHTHPGEEVAYVLEGVLLLEIDGQPAQSFKAGEAVFIPRGVVHNGRNTSAAPATLIGTYFVETGKPLATPAQ
jgi:quercetin dioxygenase-like cupin family protein